MPFQFVAVGTSFGGFHALKTVFGGLGNDFPLPIGVVQHRSHEDSAAFAPLLANHTPLPVLEVEDKEPIREGHIYVCPPNYHLFVDGDHFALSIDAPVFYARPSIDVFFESAADSFHEGVVGVLLTGMSKDGAAGLRRIKETGGYVMVQDPSAAAGRIMPKAAIAAVVVDEILPLEEIGPSLRALCVGQRTVV
jgi:two-component system, chemotaxis family, protein-glutamate methylesterase/glutaminase